MNEKDILLTSLGLEELKQELHHLITDIRPQVIEELKDARAQGDLSENADYDAARNRQAEVEARINELENMISKAKVISDNKKTKGEVKIGSEVTFLRQKSKKEMTLSIVGAIEADPFQNKISNESPLAKAMIGHIVGDVVEVREVSEPYKIEIKKIN